MFTFGRISRCLRHVSMSEVAGARGVRRARYRWSLASAAPARPRRPPPRRNAIDRLHSTATLHIDRGTNTRAAIHAQLLINAT